MSGGNDGRAQVTYDAEDLGPGPHAGTYASAEKDGHGRTIRTTDRAHTVGNQIEERYNETSYDPLGNPVKLTRRRGSQSTSRTLVYTTQGQLVINRLPGLTGPQNQGFRYAYDASGQLVGTSDPRGCGVNFAYDAAGRLLTEDYIPCEESHANYTAQPEVTYHYDTPDSEQSHAFTPQQSIQVGTQNCQTTNFTQGRLVSVTDRAQKTVTCFDGKGRAVETAKKLRLPTYSPIDPPTWSDTWHRKRVAYDGASRVFQETTGATQNTAPGNHQSIITTVYSRRGAVARVDSSYGPLVTKIKRGPNGKPLEITYGDAASTTTSYTYDDLERTRTATTFRARPSAWGPAQNDPLASKTRQLLLQDLEYTYDRVGNPVKIRDWRDPWDWPAGAKPVTRKMAYDDLYRLNKIEYNHQPGQDTWLDPFEAEHQTGPSFEKPSPSPRADFSGSTRVARQTYQYDWLGNTTSTGDDQGAFYDRSLGQVQNGGAGASPYQLRHASNESGSSARPGHLDAQYDAMGNMVAMQVHRVGKCRPASACPGNVLDQSFFYRWDEVGRLVGAERFDGVLTSVHPAMGQRVSASMKYSYDASDQRVLKFSIVGSNDAARMLMTAYIFNTLELRNTDVHYVGTGQATHFEQNQDTEAVYLFGHGVRLGRVVYAVNAAVPMVDQKMVQVLLELGDGLGSTSVVLQRGSGELVERTEHLAYGGVDSDYRPDRWGAFREPYKFTGKEEDVEVGLVYFGKRFYAPLLGRWVSADPLVVHVPGRADANLYAYVRGRVLVAVDLVGLEDASSGDNGDEIAHKAMTQMTESAMAANQKLLGPSMTRAQIVRKVRWRLREDYGLGVTPLDGAIQRSDMGGVFWRSEDRPGGSSGNEGFNEPSIVNGRVRGFVISLKPRAWMNLRAFADGKLTSQNAIELIGSLGTLIHEVTHEGQRRGAGAKLAARLAKLVALHPVTVKRVAGGGSIEVATLGASAKGEARVRYAEEALAEATERITQRLVLKGAISRGILAGAARKQASSAFPGGYRGVPWAFGAITASQTFKGKKNWFATSPMPVGIRHEVLQTVQGKK